MKDLRILLKQMLFLVLFITCSFFNNEIIANNGKILDVQDDARFSGCNYPSCEINLSYTIKMAKPFATGNKNFADLVPMYLKVYLGNQLFETIPVNFVDFVDYGEVISERSIIEWRYELTLNNQASVPFHYTGTLVTDHPTLPGYHLLYPVADYTKNASYFPCHIFDHSFGTLNIPPGCNEDEFSIPQVSKDLIFTCANCNFTQEASPTNNTPFEVDIDVPIDPFDTEGGGLPFHSNEENLTALQFQPNPFDTQLHLPFELKNAAEFEFQVFDATGKILHQEANVQDAGTHQIELDTDHWPTGVYYAQVKTGSFSKSYRLVKIE